MNLGQVSVRSGTITQQFIAPVMIPLPSIRFKFGKYT